MQRNRGFTLIELMVVIAIIGLLASVALASLESAREKARDATRIATIDQIAKALELYRLKTGNYMNSSSNCGQSGEWFFNQQYGGSARSMAQCLIDENVVEQELIDVSGNRYTPNPPSGDGDFHALMKFNCPDGSVMIFANLESVPKSSSATNGACTSFTRALDSLYGMDYYRIIQ